MSTRSPKVFFSFDFDKDFTLRHFIAGQAKNPKFPFAAADWSLKEAAPQRTWEMKARDRISRCDRVIVVLGPDTHRAPGVLKEVQIARQLGKPISQVIGYRGTHPKRVPNAGRVYKWSDANLEKLLSPVPLASRTLRSTALKPRNVLGRSRRRL